MKDWPRLPLGHHHEAVLFDSRLSVLSGELGEIATCWSVLAVPWSNSQNSGLGVLGVDPGLTLTV